MDRSTPTLDPARGPELPCSLPAAPVLLAEWLAGRSHVGLGRDLPQLWVRGQAVQQEGPRVAIVGARAATMQGLAFARELATRLAAWRQVVVSGGALGVDAAAHEGALAGDGVTLAVLGTGVDIAYPFRHAGLFERIAKTGALLSPFPPGAPAHAGHFPTRNPIIAALADSVVIVEAGLRSGSLGTAAAARKLGRPLFARPGSPGCDSLIAEGVARPALSVESLASELLGHGSVELPALPLELAGTHASLISDGPAAADALAARTAQTLPEVLTTLCELEVLGRVIRLEDGRYLALTGTADLKE